MPFAGEYCGPVCSVSAVWATNFFPKLFWGTFKASRRTRADLWHTLCPIRRAATVRNARHHASPANGQERQATGNACISKARTTLHSPPPRNGYRYLFSLRSADGRVWCNTFGCGKGVGEERFWNLLELFLGRKLTETNRTLHRRSLDFRWTSPSNSTSGPASTIRVL